MNFYPSDSNFTKALLVMPVTNIISVMRRQWGQIMFLGDEGEHIEDDD